MRQDFDYIYLGAYDAGRRARVLRVSDLAVLDISGVEYMRLNCVRGMFRIIEFDHPWLSFKKVNKGKFLIWFKELNDVVCMEISTWRRVSVNGCKLVFDTASWDFRVSWFARLGDGSYLFLFSRQYGCLGVRYVPKVGIFADVDSRQEQFFDKDIKEYAVQCPIWGVCDYFMRET